MSSIHVAEGVVEQIFEKAMHIKYQQELEAKVQPYVIRYSLEQGLKALDDLVGFLPDLRKDDKFLTSEEQQMDLEEPPCQGRDSNQPVLNVKYKNPFP